MAYLQIKMNKNQQLKKNKLDLEYHKYSQLLNGVFIFATTGFIAFLGSFIWLKERLFIGLIISVFILILSYIFYKKIDDKLKDVCDKITSI